MRGIYLFNGARMRAQFDENRAQLGKAIGREREKPVVAPDVGIQAFLPSTT
ncbi:MAG: hypothetical protein NTW47_09555 [Proteobacteria bacterium]|nr:hypothetical protein [Pseudomonadota bacterium]